MKKYSIIIFSSFLCIVIAITFYNISYSIHSNDIEGYIKKSIDKSINNSSDGEYTLENVKIQEYINFDGFFVVLFTANIDKADYAGRFVFEKGKFGGYKFESSGYGGQLTDSFYLEDGNSNYVIVYVSSIAKKVEITFMDKDYAYEPDSEFTYYIIDDVICNSLEYKSNLRIDIIE